MKMFEFRLEFHRIFVRLVPIDNKPASVQIVAWRWIGGKPLSEPMPTRFTDGEMSLLHWRHNERDDISNN